MKNSQMKIMFLFLLLAAAMPLFAADILPSGLKTMGDNVKEIFTGDLVTIILICCLAGCGIAYAFNKDNEKMKRNIIAIVIGIIIVAAAAAIVSAVMGAAK
jgi:type IV secretory pathway VirB2 component (pilin)